MLSLYLLVICCFNTQLERLINDLCNYFPENKDLKKFDTVFQLLKQSNPRKILEIFKQHITNKYKDNILSKDETFFLNYNFVEETKDNNYAGELMVRLKENWNVIDESNKETIWKYFQVLILLSEKDS
jgi:hypothetical protein